jgi:hypothetical protein
MKPKWTELQDFTSLQAKPVRIIADSVVSCRGRHAGRMIPLLLLDTFGRPDLAELIRLHSLLGSGEAKTQWGQLEEDDGAVVLILRCIRPVVVSCLIKFDIIKQGVLVDCALLGNGLYLAQAMSEDDRLVNDISRDKILIEVPHGAFNAYWNELYHKHWALHFRGEGMGQHDAQQMASLRIQIGRELFGFRMRDIL